MAGGIRHSSSHHICSQEAKGQQEGESVFHTSRFAPSGLLPPVRLHLLKFYSLLSSAGDQIFKYTDLWRMFHMENPTKGEEELGCPH